MSQRIEAILKANGQQEAQPSTVCVCVFLCMFVLGRKRDFLYRNIKLVKETVDTEIVKLLWLTVNIIMSEDAGLVLTLVGT